MEMPGGRGHDRRPGPVGWRMPALTGLAIMIEGTDDDADFAGLKEKKVVVVCRPMVSLQYRNATVARDLAQEVGDRIKANVPKVTVVDQQKVAAWADENSWDEYYEVGKALEADMVVGIDLTSFSVYEGQTLYRGRANASVAVYNVKTKEKVFQRPLPQCVFPIHTAKPAQDVSEADFRRQFVGVLADKVGRYFYAHDPHADTCARLERLPVIRGQDGYPNLRPGRPQQRGPQHNRRKTERPHFRLAAIGLHAAVTAGRRLAPHLDHPLLQVDEPILGDAGRGIQIGLLAAIVGPAAVGHFDQQQHVRRRGPMLGIIFLHKRADMPAVARHAFYSTHASFAAKGSACDSRLSRFSTSAAKRLTRRVPAGAVIFDASPCVSVCYHARSIPAAAAQVVHS